MYEEDENLGITTCVCEAVNLFIWTLLNTCYYKLFSVDQGQDLCVIFPEI